jgi:triacylglycerol lipase
LGQSARLAYEDKDTIKDKTKDWRFKQFEFFANPDTDTQAFMIANDEMIIVAFRGTQPTDLKDWMTDADLVLVNGPGGKVHKGFKEALTSVYPAVRKAIADFQTKGQSLWFTGHSNDLLQPGTDGINDHNMDRYLENLEKNVGVRPDGL